MFHFIKKGCHPKPIDELIFFRGVAQPPTRLGTIQWSNLYPEQETFGGVAGGQVFVPDEPKKMDRGC